MSPTPPLHGLFNTYLIIFSLLTKVSEIRHLEKSMPVYDLETSKKHVHNNLFLVKMYVQDIIMHCPSPLFMNKPSSSFQEITEDSKFNQTFRISLRP